jgi:hypothetical protein
VAKPTQSARDKVLNMARVTRKQTDRLRKDLRKSYAIGVFKVALSQDDRLAEYKTLFIDEVTR